MTTGFMMLFDQNRFLAEFALESDVPALRQLLDTQTFHQFLENLDSPELSLFHRLVRLEHTWDQQPYFIIKILTFKLLFHRSVIDLGITMSNHYNAC